MIRSEDLMRKRFYSVKLKPEIISGTTIEEINFRDNIILRTRLRNKEIAYEYKGRLDSKQIKERFNFDKAADEMIRSKLSKKTKLSDRYSQYSLNKIVSANELIKGISMKVPLLYWVALITGHLIMIFFIYNIIYSNLEKEIVYSGLISGMGIALIAFFAIFEILLLDRPKIKSSD